MRQAAFRRPVRRHHTGNRLYFSPFACGVLDIIEEKRETWGMVFPLEELIKYESNMYEITCAASRRAYQISRLRTPDSYDYGDEKVVSLAAREVFTHEVEFRVGNESDAIPDLLSNLKK
jgi:DNA-directed RNA polymerase subunit omega